VGGLAVALGHWAGLASALAQPKSAAAFPAAGRSAAWVTSTTPEGLTPNFWTSARVTGWFGGSEVAPRTLSYYQRA
jgi:hypothetical protein